MEPLKVGLLDDELAPLEILKEIISMIPDFEVSFSLNDPKIALKYLKEGNTDILITDIMMNELGGLELTRRISHLQIPVIFCSAYNQFALDGFRLNAIHYILKPPMALDVTEALFRAKQWISITTKPIYPQVSNASPSMDRVMIKEHGNYKKLFIDPSEIQYIEQEKRFSRIVMDKQEKISLVSTLFSTLEVINRPYLIQVHRSFAINYLKIKEIENIQCVLTSGVKITIGKEFREDFYGFLKSKSIL